MKAGSVRFFVGAGLLLLALTCASTAAAQTTASLSGTVKDTQGGVIPGVTVELTSETKGTKLPAAITSATGDFTFVNIAPDSYKISVSLTGFKTLNRGGVALSAGDRVSIGTMVLEVGGASEAITVSSEAPLLQTQTGDRSFTATQSVVDNLPFASRSFVAMAQLAPGVFDARAPEGAESDYQIARVGATSRDNAYFMDGASMMDTGSNRPVVQINTEAIGLFGRDHVARIIEQGACRDLAELLHGVPRTDRYI